jgi:hypothetical protein
MRAGESGSEHTLGRLQFGEWAGEVLALRIDARECFAEPLLFLGDLVQSRRFVSSRRV